MQLSVFLALSVLITQGLSAMATPTSSPPNSAIVNLRVEGLNRTIYEGPIRTRGHNITTVSGGTHHCDGTNNNENPTPGPTCTSALDDASRKAHFTLDGYVIVNFDELQNG